MLVPIIPTTFDQVLKRLFEADCREECVTAPPCNVIEKDNAFDLSIALPGVKKEDIRLETRKDKLKVYSDSKKESERKNEKWTNCCEFSYQHFTREFTLPKTVSRDGITAKHENGVLTIHIPKLPEMAEEGAKQIAIG